MSDRYDDMVCCIGSPKTHNNCANAKLIPIYLCREAASGALMIKRGNTAGFEASLVMEEKNFHAKDVLRSKDVTNLDPPPGDDDNSFDDFDFAHY